MVYVDEDECLLVEQRWDFYDVVDDDDGNGILLLIYFARSMSFVYMFVVFVLRLLSYVIDHSWTVRMVRK
jgi:hypothetical protein